MFYFEGGWWANIRDSLDVKKKVAFHFISFWFCFGTLKKLHSFVHAIISEKRILKKNYSLSWNKGKHQKIWNRHNLNKVSPAKPKYCWGNISILVLWIRWHLSVISNNHFYSFLFQFLILFVFSNHFMLNFLSYILGKLGNI